MKHYMSFALAAVIFYGNVSADNTGYFKVTYNGEEIRHGATVAVTERSGEEKCRYTPMFLIENLLETELLLSGGMYYTDTPTYAMVRNDRNYWGQPQFCMSSCYANGDEECVGHGTELIKNKATCLPEVLNCDPDAISCYKVRLTPCYGTIGQGNYVEISEAAFEMTIRFSNEDSGIHDIPGPEKYDNPEPVFFNVQGKRVDVSAPGIYIEKRGDKVRKIIF